MFKKCVVLLALVVLLGGTLVTASSLVTPTHIGKKDAPISRVLHCTEPTEIKIEEKEITKITTRTVTLRCFLKKLFNLMKKIFFLLIQIIIDRFGTCCIL